MLVETVLFTFYSVPSLCISDSEVSKVSFDNFPSFTLHDLRELVVFVCRDSGCKAKQTNPLDEVNYTSHTLGGGLEACNREVRLHPADTRALPWI